MRKFKKIDLIYIVFVYFMTFAFIGIIFNSIQDAMAWSISIFIISYIAYCIIKYIEDMKNLFLK